MFQDQYWWYLMFYCSITLKLFFDNHESGICLHFYLFFLLIFFPLKFNKIPSNLKFLLIYWVTGACLIFSETFSLHFTMRLVLSHSINITKTCIPSLLCRIVNKFRKNKQKNIKNKTKNNKIKYIKLIHWLAMMQCKI